MCFQFETWMLCVEGGRLAAETTKMTEQWKWYTVRHLDFERWVMLNRAVGMEMTFVLERGNVCE